jgi:hypothetical protein
LLARPPTVTTTRPLVEPDGTSTTMLVADQLVGVAVVPLNLLALTVMHLILTVVIVGAVVVRGRAPRSEP